MVPDWLTAVVPAWLVAVYAAVLGVAGFLAKPVFQPILKILMKPTLEWLEDRQIAPRVTLELPICTEYATIEPLATFKYLVVRYGTLGDLTDERKDNRQAENTHRGSVKIRKGVGDTTILILRLPVHRRFGTFFKLSALPKESGEIDRLRKTLEIASDDIVVGDSSEGQVWFVLSPKNPKFNRFEIRMGNNYVSPR